MKNMINYEKRRYRDKMRELMTLFIFTIGAGIISLIVMDIIILPLTLFAINNKMIFNYIMKDFMVIFIIFIILFLIFKKIYGYVKDGYNLKEIIKYLIKKPVNILGSFFIIVLLTSSIVLILYLILSLNNYQIYRFIQS